MPESSLSTLLDPTTLARIDNYSLLARTVVEGFVSGLHRSLYHGFGSEFFQYRNYVPGDDLKYIDWKVFGRQDRFYTKVYQEETNLNCCIVLDASASMDYTGSNAPCSKSRYACMVAACIAYLANRQGDSVGLCAYNDGLLSSVQPGRSKDGLTRVLRELQRLRPSGVADHKRALNFVAENFRRRGIVVLISDLHGAEGDLPRFLKRFRHAHHDSIVLQVLDGEELDFPFSATTRFLDAESKAEIATAPTLVREHYLREMQSFTEGIKDSCLAEQVDYLLMRTDASLGHMLAAYLHRREALSL